MTQIWGHIDEVDAVDNIVADVLRDMSTALHDSIEAPDVARNFDSTPEQLLIRLG